MRKIVKINWMILELPPFMRDDPADEVDRYIKIVREPGNVCESCGDGPERDGWIEPDDEMIIWVCDRCQWEQIGSGGVYRLVKLGGRVEQAA